MSEKNGKKDQEGLEMMTDTPLNPIIGIRTDLDPQNPFSSEDYHPGDSVAGHKNLEESNQYIAKKELGQINENS